MGGIHALEHAAIGMMPLLVMTDRNDLGGISIPFHPQVEKAVVFVYDGVPGGLGLTLQAFDNTVTLMQSYYQDDMKKLVERLGQMDLIIGFNITRFDYKVLSGLSRFNFHSLPTLDILTKVHERLGYRLSLDHLVCQTLGLKKVEPRC